MEEDFQQKGQSGVVDVTWDEVADLPEGRAQGRVGALEESAGGVEV